MNAGWPVRCSSLDSLLTPTEAPAIFSVHPVAGMKAAFVFLALVASAAARNVDVASPKANEEVKAGDNLVVSISPSVCSCSSTVCRYHPLNPASSSRPYSPQAAPARLMLQSSSVSRRAGRTGTVTQLLKTTDAFCTTVLTTPSKVMDMKAGHTTTP